MGLWQNLVMGYDENPELCDMESGGLYPLSSITISNNSKMLIVLTLNQNGDPVGSPCYEIVQKRNDKVGNPLRTFVIPVTERSMSRTSGDPVENSLAHPIFDQRKYVFPKFTKNGQEETRHNEAYKALLEEFATSKFSTESIKSVWKYISRKNYDFTKDLPQNVKDDVFILFRVEIPGKINSALWSDTQLFSAWHSFYMEKRLNESSQTLDFITGDVQTLTQTHPKQIFLNAANAKLISANDDSNFTFRGKFHHPKDLKKKEAWFKCQFGLTDAVTIGYESSQKAYQFLRYLIVKQGIPCDTQVIVPFTIAAKGEKLLNPPIREEDVEIEIPDEESNTVTDVQMSVLGRTGFSYAKSISKALAGYKLNKDWFSHAKTAIVIMEAATDGRLSVTFYRELSSVEYLERIKEWHEFSEWPLYRKKKDEPLRLYFGAPSVDQIINTVFGWSNAKEDEAYKKIKKQARQNLIQVIFNNLPIPFDYLTNAVQRVSNPLAIKVNERFNRERFFTLLSTTCSMLKHYYTNKKEAFGMSLDESRTDRDYLYGRLLGAADKLEEYALRKKENDRNVTAAIRYMQTFSMRPFTTWETIHSTLLPYIQQVKNSIAFSEIQLIQNKFRSIESYEDDNPLSGLYLIGYYHEREYIDMLVRAKISRKESND